MADFVATIKVNIESITGQSSGGKSSASEGTSSSSSSSSSSDSTADTTIRTLQQLQEEFRTLSANIRSVSTSLEQLKNIEGAPSDTGAPSVVSTTATGPGIATAVAALNEIDGSATAAAASTTKQSEANKEAADSADRQAQSTVKGTKATTDQATAEQLLAEMHAAAASQATASAKASDVATKAELNRINALQKLEGTNPRRNPKTDRLSQVRQFTEIAEPLGGNEDFRKLANQSVEEIADLVKIPPGVFGQMAKDSQKVKDRITDIIRDAVTDIDTSGGVQTAKSIRNKVNSVRDQINLGKDTLGSEGAPTVDFDAVKIALAARVLATSLDKTTAKMQVLGEALEKGTDAEGISTAEKSSREGIASTISILQAVSKTLFDTQRRTGKPGISDGAETFQQLKEEGLVGSRGPTLQGSQLKAFKSFKEGIASLAEPMVVVRQVIAEMIDEGRGLRNLSATLRELKDALPVNQSDFIGSDGLPNRQQFLRAKEARETIGAVKVTEQGVVSGPAGAISRSDSILAARSAIDIARQKAASNFEPGQGPIKISIPITDAQGNVKKLDITLKAFGNTIDSVRVKASDLSKNAFDKTSVRAALQRVAVWGAAAGIVFTAFNSLKQGINVLVDTESSLVSLSKVMNESASDLNAFKDTAQSAAISIAKDFGQPLEDVLETMILFGQQGRNLKETIELSKAAALASSVTTLNQPDAASALTAATQQFGLEFTDATSIVDKFNEVANNAAVTETDLAQALKKAGQAAKNAGLDLDEFNGVVAAIAEQTRQSGNEIGTALRFIFSRLQTPEAQKGLAAVGVSARDASGNIRAFTPIVRDLAEKFDTLTNSQKTQVAISIAGTRRFNTLLALLSNFDRFQDAAANSTNSAGSAMKEQAQVVGTASFKIQKLVNSLKELALSFGSSLLDPLKFVVDALSLLVGGLSVIPGFMKTTAAATAIGGLAFVKFSDHLTDFLGLAGAVKGASGSVSTAIKASLFTGVSESEQIERGADKALVTSGSGLVAARTGADLTSLFGKGGKTAESFAGTLKKSNLLLVNQRGQVLKNTAVFGKLGSVIRGFGTVSTNAAGGIATGAAASTLALGSLNSGVLKFIGFLGILSRSVIKATLIGPALFDGLDAGAQRLGNTLPRVGKAFAALNTGLRFAGAGLAIYGVVLALTALKDALFESGEETAKSLEPEIQKRKEIVAELAKQESRVNSLSSARRKAALSAGGPNSSQALTPVQQQDSLAGRFKSPEVALANIRKQEQEIANSIGFADPTLIDSIDDFGNVILDSSVAFDTLAKSASSAQKVLLGLAQVKVIKGFSDELKPEDTLLKDAVGLLKGASPVFEIGFDFVFGDNALTSISERFDTERKKFEENLNDPTVKSAKSLGLSIRDFDPAAAEKLNGNAVSLQKASLAVRNNTEAIEAHIQGLTKDSGSLVFENLSRDARTAFERQVQLSSTQGVETNVEALVNRAFLINSSALKQVSKFIDVNNDLTIGNLREGGVSVDLAKGDDLRKSKDDLDKFIGTLGENDLVLFKTVEGVDRKAKVQITSAGNKVIEFFNAKLGSLDTQSAAEAFNDTLGDIFVVDTEGLKKQFTIALEEVNRVVSGAGRGGLLSKDIDIGANFRSDLSSQQRASQGDELLFSDLRTKQKELDNFRSTLTGPTTKDDGSIDQLIDPVQLATIKTLAGELDALATSARIASEIEKVGAAFEKAALKIKESRIDEEILSEFSGGIGKISEGIRAGFQLPSLSEFANASPQSEAAAGNTSLGNQLSQSNKEVGNFVGGLRKAEENVRTFLRDFTVARLSGGSSDPTRLSDLARRAAALTSTGLSNADSILVSVNTKQLDEQVKGNDLLTQIAALTTNDPKILGAALAAQSLSSKGDPEQLSKIAAVIEANRDKVSSFAQEDKLTLASNIPSKEIPSLIDATVKSTSKELASNLASELLNFKDGSDGGSVKSFESILREVRITSAKFSQSIPKEETDRDQIANALTTALTGPQFSSLLEASKTNSVGEVVVDDAKLKEILSLVVAKLSDTIEEKTSFFGTNLPGIPRESSAKVEKAVLNLEKIIAEDGADLTSLLQLVSKAVLGTAGFAAKEGTVSPDSVVAKTVQDRADAATNLNKSLQSTATANDAVLKPLRDTFTALVTFQKSIKDTGEALKRGLQSAIDGISIDRSLSKFNSPQVGPLAGVNVSGVQLDLRGPGIGGLSGRELTALDNPEISRGLTDVDAAFKGLVTQLELVKQAELDAQAALAKTKKSGDVKGIQLAKEALTQLGGVSLLVEGQVNTAQDTLKSFSRSFKGLEVINQLRVDVENFVSAFDKEISLKFDNTSIQTALGGTPFSSTRPTFENFEQGQGGNLTKFERAIASLDFQESKGQITSQVASRGRKEAEFNKNEETIALVQGRENEKLQSAVKTAEQVRDRLFDFVQSGAPGAEAAQGLINQITSELETAGDIIPGGGFGSTSIRDPRTGQQVDVKASQVNSFKGLPGLSGITQQLAGITRKVEQDTAQRNADLITQPLITVLDLIPDKLDKINETLQNVSGIGDTGSLIADSDALNALTAQSSKLAPAIQQTGDLTGANVTQFTEAVNTLKEQLNPEQLARLLSEGSVPSADGGSQPFLSALRDVTLNSSVSEGTKDVDNIASATLSLIDKANLASGPDFSIFTEVEGSFESLSTNISTQAEAIGTSLSGVTDGKLQEGILSTVNALNLFRDTLTTGNFGPGPSNSNEQFFGSSGVLKRARGGLITGPGGPTEDKVPVLASPGEFVINAKSAKSIGIDNLNRLNGSAANVSSDSRASGASLAFAEGGLVDVNVLFKQQKLDRAESKRQDEIAKKAKVEEDKSTPRGLRIQIQRLQIERQALLNTSPPNTVQAESVAGKISVARDKLAVANIKRQKERERFSELKSYKEAGLQAPSVLASEEQVIRKNQEQDLNTFRGGPRDKSFVGVSDDGQRFVSRGSPFKGSTDSADLKGVSSRSPQEFLAELERRKVIDKKVRSNRTDTSINNSIELSNLQLKDQQDTTEKKQVQSYNAAYVDLNSQIGDRTGKYVERFFSAYTRGFSAAETSNEILTGERDAGHDDYIIQSKEADKASSELDAVYWPYVKAQKSPVTLAAPPSFTSAPDFKLPLGSAIGGEAAYIFGTKNGNAQASTSTKLFLDKPQVTQPLDKLVDTRLNFSLEGLGDSLREGGTFSAFQGRNNFIKDQAAELQDAIKYATVAFGLDADGFVADRLGNLGAITDVVGDIAGAPGTIAGQLAFEPVTTRSVVGSLLKANPLVGIVDAFKGGAATNEKQDVVNEKRIAYKNASPGDKRKAGFALIDAKFDRDKAATGTIAVVGSGVLALNKLKGFTTKARAGLKASKINNFKDASALATNAKKTANRLKRKDPRGSKQSLADAKSFEARAKRLKIVEDSAARKTLKTNLRADKLSATRTSLGKTVDQRGVAGATSLPTFGDSLRDKLVTLKSSAASIKDGTVGLVGGAKRKLSSGKKKLELDELNRVKGEVIDGVELNPEKFDLSGIQPQSKSKFAKLGFGGTGSTLKQAGIDALTGLDPLALLEIIPGFKRNIRTRSPGRTGLGGRALDGLQRVSSAVLGPGIVQRHLVGGAAAGALGAGTGGVLAASLIAPVVPKLLSVFSKGKDFISSKLSGKRKFASGIDGSVQTTAADLADSLFLPPAPKGVASAIDNISAQDLAGVSRGLPKSKFPLPASSKIEQILEATPEFTGPRASRLQDVKGNLPRSRFPEPPPKGVQDAIDSISLPNNIGDTRRGEILSSQPSLDVPTQGPTNQLDAVRDKALVNSVKSNTKVDVLPPESNTSLGALEIDSFLESEITKQQQFGIALQEGKFPLVGENFNITTGSDIIDVAAAKIKNPRKNFDLKRTATEGLDSPVRDGSSLSEFDLIEQIKEQTEIDLKAIRIFANLGNDVTVNNVALAQAEAIARANTIRGSGVFGLLPSDPAAQAKFAISVQDTGTNRILKQTGSGSNTAAGVHQPGRSIDQTLVFRDVIEDGLDLSIPEHRAVAAEKAQGIAAHEIEHRLGSDSVFAGGATSDALGSEIIMNKPDVAAAVKSIQSKKGGFLDTDNRALLPGLEGSDVESILPDVKRILEDTDLSANSVNIGGDAALVNQLTQDPLSTANKRIQNANKFDLLREHLNGGDRIPDVELKARLETIFENELYADFNLTNRKRASLYKKYGLDYDKSLDLTDIKTPEIVMFDGDVEVGRYASGGLLKGPGGPKSDDIPILASAGEFIVNANSVNSLGLSTLEQLNTTGKLPAFKEGGDVSGRTSSGLNINTDEIAAAITQAISKATSAATISINADAAAQSISAAVTSALSNLVFPDVKLDSSSLDAVSLGNSLGSAVRDKLEKVEGSVFSLRESTTEIFSNIEELNLLKDNFSRQEEEILNKVEFRLNQEKSTTQVDSKSLETNKQLAIIRGEMVRIERELKQTTSQASLALAKAQATK